MKIKDYKLFIESKTDIDSICKKYGIKNYTINDDVTIDVDSYVNLTEKGLTKLPLKFGKVTGYFDCSDNQLTSLEGAPYYVGGYFSCYNNQLKTLEGGPETIIGGYYCLNNKLINFKGFPEHYEGEIWFSNNPVYRLLIKIPDEKRNQFIYWCNEYDAIADNGVIIYERIEEVYNQIGLIYNNNEN